MAKLTNAQAKAVTAPGRYGDGQGLQLFVKKTGSKTWVLRYSFAGERRDMGLGKYPETSLAEARRNADQIRAQIRDGIAPRGEKRIELPAAKAVPSFAEVAEKLITALEPTWRNPKHRQQWRNTLDTYAKPIADMPIDEVRTSDVLECLAPIWLSKAETAARLRGRIERLIDYAIALDLRPEEMGNPAVMKGKIQHLLPKRDRSPINHREAMSWREIPVFMEAMRGVRGIGPRLSASRSSRPQGPGKCAS